MKGLLAFFKKILMGLSFSRATNNTDTETDVSLQTSPPKPSKVYKGKIVIDPGHGGRSGRPDPGAVGSHEGDPVYERDVVLDISVQLALILEKKGYLVVMTRVDNSTLSTLGDKVKIVNQENPDVFVSIHANSNAGKPAQGIETLYHRTKPGSMQLAQRIQDALIKAFPRHRNRGIKERSRLYVLRASSVPACCLVECEFINHPDQVKFLLEKPEEIAAAIASGIITYLS
jgi:N-acetylmuramoyl-L-alanine amidase